VNLLSKFKETSSSVIPILLIVLVLYLTLAPIGIHLLASFLVGGILIIIGLSLFLLGTEIGLIPVGQRIGSALVRRRSLSLILIAGFFIGFLVTVAEPQVQILASQVTSVNPSISPFLLVLMIALGVGLFVAIGTGRILLRIPLKLILIIFYLIVFALAVLTEETFVGIAFDAGGATTGPMTVPFIMALGLGVSAVRKTNNSSDESFGLVGMASIGPILAVLLMGYFFHDSSTVMDPSVQSSSDLSLGATFWNLIPETLWEVSIALGPLVLLFILFQLFLLHMPFHQIARMAKGFVYTFIGLSIFLVGVNGGFLQTGAAIGSLIGALEYNWVLIPIGFILGAVAVLAEPAVWVLTDQVREISGGHIRKRIMVFSFSIGVAIAVALSMVRVVTSLSIWWLLVPGYTIAFGLTIICPKLFTAIAFDSGGVASGPMSSTFILAFTLGASQAAGGNPFSDAFGVVAMIAMTPLITLQILGLLYKRRDKQKPIDHFTADEEEPN
jgi:hypothetical protein